jgi:Uma2 family endonuclease
MATPARRRATYEDILRAPEDMVAEVIDGELHLHPRPRRRHLRSASMLGSFLTTTFDAGINGPGGWIVIDEPELHLGPEPDIVVPDLAAWREDRYPGDVDDDDAFFTMAPDWACEILSPRTARVDRTQKMPIYARERIRHVWIVDPRDRLVEVFRLDEAHYVLLGTWGGGDDAVALEPFEAVPIAPQMLWGRRRSPRPEE